MVGLARRNTYEDQGKSVIGLQSGESPQQLVAVIRVRRKLIESIENYVDPVKVSCQFDEESEQSLDGVAISAAVVRFDGAQE